MAAHWPSPSGYVNDFAHVVPADQAQDLENYLSDVEQRTGAQIAVVTLPSVEGGDIDRAAVELFKAWGIGQKGKDNGILILASIGDRRARIEVGYGLEGVITDADAGDILRQQVYPYFKQKQYGQGLSNAAHAVADRITPSDQAQANQDEMGIGMGQALKIILIILFIILYFYIRIRYRLWWIGGWGGGGWGGGGFGGGGGGFGGFGGGGSGGGGASGGW